MSAPCCEKCFDEGVSQLSYGGCRNSSCPCHQTHTPKEGWEERFDEAIPHNYLNDVLTVKKAKAFIASEITKAQVEERERIFSELSQDSSRSFHERVYELLGHATTSSPNEHDGS